MWKYTSCAQDKCVLRGINSTGYTLREKASSKSTSCFWCASPQIVYPENKTSWWKENKYIKPGRRRKDKTKQCISEFICSLPRDLSNLQLESFPRILGALGKLEYWVGPRSKCRWGQWRWLSVFCVHVPLLATGLPLFSPNLFFSQADNAWDYFNHFKCNRARAPAPQDRKLINVQMKPPKTPGLNHHTEHLLLPVAASEATKMKQWDEFDGEQCACLPYPFAILISQVFSVSEPSH